MTPLPSNLFSLIIESENLVSCDASEIENMLNSLLNQSRPITEANEVIIGDNGLIPQSIIERIKRLIPNLKMVNLAREMTYYEAKNYLAQEATGDVIVFCDSDCVYERQWLEEMTQSFVEDPNLNILAGETTIKVQDVYSLGIALNYMLHRSSSFQKRQPSKFYYLNNVAFRKDMFLSHPLPCHIKLFRGTCSVHSKLLQASGYTIWKNTNAKAFHLPPQTLRYYVLRFLLMGHDNYWLDRYLSSVPLPVKSSTPKNSPQTDEMMQDSSALDLNYVNTKTPYKKRSLLTRLKNRYDYIVNQIKVYYEEYRFSKVSLVVALPIAIMSQFLVTLGRLITQVNSLFTQEPHWLYHRLAQLLD